MTLTSALPRVLPIRVRLQPGETAESFIHRLARANHLLPSLLRRYLATPTGSYGPIHRERLATLSGRTIPALLHVLPDLNPRPQPRRHGVVAASEAAKTLNHERKRQIFVAIRQDADAGMSDRAILRKHKVGLRTVQKALASPIPPPRKGINRPTVALRGLQDRIDTMLDTNPAIQTADVWQQLVDNHGSTASYATVRDYIAAKRSRKFSS
jgi:hypothetical protein